jgi:Transposase
VASFIALLLWCVRANRTDRLGVSPATLYNWRRADGGMDTDAAKELKELRAQNSRLKRLLAGGAGEGRAAGGREGKILSPAAKRRAVDMLKQTLDMSERLACKAVGLARSTYRCIPIAATPADPDADLRAWLRRYATKHPCHGFRRARPGPAGRRGPRGGTPFARATVWCRG